MRKVKVEELEEGMKLARPVTGGMDMVLMAAGTVLTARLIERLKNLNLRNIAVEGESQPSVSLEEEIRSLDDRFENVRDNPHMSFIYEAVRSYIEARHE